MKESTQYYKFGTWYPIEELNHSKDVLFYIGRLGRSHTGYKYKDKLYKCECDRSFLLRPPAEFEEEFTPCLWMPLPPRPGEE